MQSNFDHASEFRKGAIMSKELIINASLPETRIAMLEEGRIQELLIERESEKGIVGNIYKGKVTRVLPGMQAAFVDIGLEKAAFLYVDDVFVHSAVMGEDTETEEAGNEDESEEAPAPLKLKRRIEPAQQADAQDDGMNAAAAQDSELQETGEQGEDQAGDDQTDEQTDDQQAADAQAQAYDEQYEGEQESGSQEMHAAEGTDSDGTDAEALEHAAENEDSDADDGQADFADESTDENSDNEDYSDEEQNENAEQDLDASQDYSQEDGQESEISSDSQNEDSVSSDQFDAQFDSQFNEGGAEVSAADGESQSLAGLSQDQGRGRRDRGRGRKIRGKGGRNRKGRDGPSRFPREMGATNEGTEDLPGSFNDTMADSGNVDSDRSSMGDDHVGQPAQRRLTGAAGRPRAEFKEHRNKDRRIKSKNTRQRVQANIGDLLTEGQEVIVQVAKDPIATKGARLTCHVSLAGRHLVCMPTIDHVGVSRRIERDDERRRLRTLVEKNRSNKMGFIVRTASSGKDTEAWVRSDVQYLSGLWHDIKQRADESQAPNLVYEDLNPILKAIRDWVNEDISKIIVDSRYHYNELLNFAERFMPSLSEKLELYQGDIPVFDAYGISSELHRSLERKVWLKSGGYIVIDQAEALVAIDVNTGRFVGKRSLEDTILKTNLEAAEEIAYQLRVRNCGGIIICDFIDMERDENRMRVFRALDEALKRDRARPTIQKISDLGLVEMTRKRTRDTVIRTLCEPCSHCEGKGFIKSQKTVAYEILRDVERMGIEKESKKILVSAHSAVIDLLAIDFKDTLDALERRYHKQVYLQVVQDFHSEQYEVVSDRSQAKKFQQQDIARQMRADRERNERKDRFQIKKKLGFKSSAASAEGEDANTDSTGENFDQEFDANQNLESNVDQNENYSDEGSFESDAGNEGELNAPIIRPRPVIQAQGANYAQASQQNDENFGNSISYKPKVQTPAEPLDEDQLAYLRAQAAQDAAIASLTAGASGNSNPNQARRGPRPQHGRGPGGGAGGGRGGQRRPQRGGRFRPKFRGGGSGGAGNGGGSPGNQ
jgi:Rne/Rng family ribonuclease